MTMEVICGQCQTSFQVDDGSLMVECPQCGIPMVLGESTVSSGAAQLSNVLESPQPETALSLPVTSPTAESSPEVVIPENDNRTEFISTPPPRQRRGVSGTLFFLVFSYASLVTLAFAYYFWMTSNYNASVLENLPDIEPKNNANGSAQSLLIPENADMPRGHTLKLGESRRFGDLVVTPLKVTKEPLQFVRFDGAASKENQKPATSNVLKLWVRFKNVSSKSSIKPLGRKLTFKRGMESFEHSKIRANQFVCRLSDKLKSQNIWLLYDLPVQDIWDLKDQNIDHNLQPGKSFTTYLPTSEEAVNTLTGELVWRVHFRKGHNKKSLRGVTTLLEVRFSKSDILQNKRDL